MKKYYLTCVPLLLAALALPPCHAAENPLEAARSRLTSCDPKVVRAAVDQLLRDPQTLAEPMGLFDIALAQRDAGDNDEAALLFLAAKLRVGRQILFLRGDRPQLLSVMEMVVGPMIMPYLEADPARARRIVQRAIDWDKTTPDPLRAQQNAAAGEIQQRLAAIDAGLARLPDQIRITPGLAAQARAANLQAEQAIRQRRAASCAAGVLDAAWSKDATQRINQQAIALVMADPLVRERAGGAIDSAYVLRNDTTASGLPSRLAISIDSAHASGFWAQVDVKAAVTAERTLGAVSTTLACVSEMADPESGQSDVCDADKKALRPAAQP